MIVAHVAGVPVEELLPSTAGIATALAMANAWLWLRFRRDRQEPDA